MYCQGEILYTFTSGVADYCNTVFSHNLQPGLDSFNNLINLLLNAFPFALLSRENCGLEVREGGTNNISTYNFCLWVSCAVNLKVVQ
jgi:hypothetical protein